MEKSIAITKCANGWTVCFPREDEDHKYDMFSRLEGFAKKLKEDMHEDPLLKSLRNIEEENVVESKDPLVEERVYVFTKTPDLIEFLSKTL